jgi:hypothetical protein
MRFDVRALIGGLAVATAGAAVVVIAMPRTASDRPGAIQGATVVAAAGPHEADPTPPPPTADPIDVPSDQNLVRSANLFLTVDLVVVTGLWLIIVLSVGWIVVRFVRGGKF